MIPTKDLLKGDEGRKRVMYQFAEIDGFTVKKRDVDGSRDFDLGGPTGDWARVEVKNEDNYAESTNNICVECYQGNPRKVSGILATESTVVIHTLGKLVVLYRSMHMRNFINAELDGNRIQLRRFGDNSNQGVILDRYRMSERYPSWFHLMNFEDLPKDPLLFGMPPIQPPPGAKPIGRPSPPTLF